MPVAPDRAQAVAWDSFDDTAVLVYASGIVTAGAWVFEQVKAHDFEGMPSPSN